MESMHTTPAVRRRRRGRRHGCLSRQKRRNVTRGNIEAFSKSYFRPLASRGGVKRVSGLLYADCRSVLKNFLEELIYQSLRHAKEAARNTVALDDVKRSIVDDEIHPLNLPTKLGQVPISGDTNNFLQDKIFCSPNLGKSFRRARIITNAGMLPISISPDVLHSVIWKRNRSNNGNMFVFGFSLGVTDGVNASL